MPSARYSAEVERSIQNVSNLAAIAHAGPALEAAPERAYSTVMGKKDKKKKKKDKGDEPELLDASGPSAAGEVGEDVEEVEAIEAMTSDLDLPPSKKQLKKQQLRELAKLQIELVKLQEWVRTQGLKVVVLFEGRDAAGKGGVIKRITQSLNPRVCRVVALATPTERERTQWYFQRYVAHLPAAGEIVLFDRSWYNRAGVERVMGFCTPEEYEDFMRSCPDFERMLIDSGIILIKYWFSVSDQEQERRFQDRMKNPTKRWKLSPMDLESRKHWVEYSKAKDAMFERTDVKWSPWWVVNADDKNRARLNCIAHLLSQVPYRDLTPEELVLPPRQPDSGYVRPPRESQRFVPERY